MASVAADGDRRASLEALRDLLAGELDGPGHDAGCECACGVDPRDARVIAGLAKEFRAVIDLLDAIPTAKEDEPLDRIAGNVNDELGNVTDLASRRPYRGAGPAAS